MRNITIFLILVLVIMGISFFGMRMNRNNFIAPTGQFGVGTTSYHLVDAQRKETNMQPDSARELCLHIWYPATVQKEPCYMLYD